MRRALIALAVLLTSCTGRDALDASTTRAQRGDTLVLRHAGVGAWGAGAFLERVATFGEADGNDSVTLGAIVALAEGSGRVFATDRQRLGVRVFDGDLRPIAIWGRAGSGPGELRNPDGGLAVFSDGRVAVRDPGNARLQLYDANGSSAGEWRVVDAGLRTRDNFGVIGDTLLSRVVTKAQGSVDTWEYGMARIAAAGRVLDTVAIPEQTIPRATLVARRGGNTAELPVPFAPTSLLAWHPRGGFVLARGDRYAITWPLATGPVTVERVIDPVAVSSAEAAQERAYVTKGMQWLDPAWTWNGPELPREKPLISRLFTGLDGSVWALREGEAIEGDDPDYRPGDASSVERRWRSRQLLDAFTADGDFLGTVEVPSGLQLERPQPVFTRDGLVAVELDRVGVPRIVRYRVKHATGD